MNQKIAERWSGPSRMQGRTDCQREFREELARVDGWGMSVDLRAETQDRRSGEGAFRGDSRSVGSDGQGPGHGVRVVDWS